MDKWIEELREKVENDPRLMCPYISYSTDDKIITLDGNFTVDQIEEIAGNMKKYNKG
jgi:hypothetical protein